MSKIEEFWAIIVLDSKGSTLSNAPHCLVKRNENGKVSDLAETFGECSDFPPVVVRQAQPEDFDLEESEEAFEKAIKTGAY